MHKARTGIQTIMLATKVHCTKTHLSKLLFKHECNVQSEARSGRQLCSVDFGNIPTGQEVKRFDWVPLIATSSKMRYVLHKDDTCTVSNV